MTAFAASDIKRWNCYVGRTESRTQVIDLESLRRFAAASGASLDVERRPPPLAHWAFFLEVVRPSQIGTDGHVVSESSILPPVHPRLRMFAASTIQLLGPLEIGLAAELTHSLVGMKHRVKQGNDMLFFDIDRRVVQGQVTRVVERQTIVYRASLAVTAPVDAVSQDNTSAGEIWMPSSVDLFRFSAATFNAHRIHYDAAYAREKEGYPDLVVQGPFTAAKLFEVAQRDEPPIRHFSFRASAPLFVGQPVRLERGPGAGEVQAIRCDGTLAMSARAV